MLSFIQVTRVRYLSIKWLFPFLLAPTHHFSRSPFRSESPNIFSVVSANSIKLATNPRIPHLPLKEEFYHINVKNIWKHDKHLCFGGLASSMLLICCCITLYIRNLKLTNITLPEGNNLAVQEKKDVAKYCVPVKVALRLNKRRSKSDR